MNDYIIIGCGISALYAAYNIQKKYPNAKITILEKEKIGGRIGLKEFYGVNVPIGAGIGRKGDKLLLSLLKELNIPTKKIKLNSFSMFKKINILTDLKLLRDQFKKYKKKKTNKNPTFKKFAKKILKKKTNKNPKKKTNKNPKKKTNKNSKKKTNKNPKKKTNKNSKKKTNKNPTFKKFAKKILKKKYKLFIQSSGFSDYENEDVQRTLYNYNMEDNVRNGIGYLINWNLLLDKLVQCVCANENGNKNANTTIKIEEVKSFKRKDDKIIVKGSNAVYNTHKLIIATTATSLHKLLSGYKYVCGQPFLRMYAKFNPSNILINRMKELNNTNCILTDGPLQKILPINIEKGIYMISYSDNSYALALKPYIKNTNKNRKYFEKLFNECLFSHLVDNCEKRATIALPTIKALWGKFWDIGTHYFAPTEKKVNQMPFDNIFIIGEMISEHQGWTEGALDSVEKIKKYL
uniref:Amine oxidase domain-containing protein n=1 Tax=viral metagenome TaxID=1070528 RepID=A0A6C0I0F9_9ZZZZ